MSTNPRPSIIPALLAFAVAAAQAVPAPGHAQLANASTAAHGMAENYTAVARGIDAVAWNPAGLGLRGTGGSSFAALVVRGGTGLGPVTLGDMADWSNDLVPAAVKADWLERIVREGGETGSAGADVTWLALQFGQFAVHAATSARAQAALAPGAAELALFGNVGESGQAQALDLDGSSGLATAHSAIGASFALPFFPERGGRVALGATIKYVVGHALAVGDNSAGATTVDPLAIVLDFPAVHTSGDGGAADGNGGSGFGLDVGLGWDSPGGLSVGLTVRNIVNSFEWDTDELRFAPLSVRLDQDTTLTDTDDLPFTSAPVSLRSRVADLKFHPEFAAGIAYRVTGELMVTGDVRVTRQDGLRTGPARHMGGGLEYRPVPWLPLRAGAAAISDGEENSGYQAAAGIGFDLGSWNLAASLMRRDASLGSITSVMVTLFGMGR